MNYHLENQFSMFHKLLSLEIHYTFHYYLYKNYVIIMNSLKLIPLFKEQFIFKVLIIFYF